jgi:hypothetical protein
VNSGSDFPAKCCHQYGQGTQDTSEYETVYNLRIADFHTYFLGSEAWGFAVWAHNAECVVSHENGQYTVRNRETQEVLRQGTDADVLNFAIRGNHDLFDAAGNRIVIPESATLLPNTTRRSRESVGNLQDSLVANNQPQPGPDHVGHHVLPGTVYRDAPVLRDVGFKIDFHTNGQWLESGPNAYHRARHDAYTAALRRLVQEIPMPEPTLQGRSRAAAQVDRLVAATKRVLSSETRPFLYVEDYHALGQVMSVRQLAEIWESAIRAQMR